MPYNIQFQVAALFIMALGGFLLIKKRAVRRYMQRTYLYLFLASAVSICLDILSVILIVEAEDGFWTMLVCKAYLFSIALVTLFVWRYVLTEVYTGSKRWEAAGILSHLPVVAQLVILSMDTVEIYHEGLAVYTYGTGVLFTYCCSVFYLLCCFVCSLRYFRRMPVKVRYSVWFLISVWTISAIIQVLHNELLVVGFAMALAMIYMYILMENPETYTDSESGALNALACTEYLQRLFQQRKRVWAVQILVDRLSYVTERVGTVYSMELLGQIVSFFSQAGGRRTLAFRTGSNSFCVFCEDEEHAKGLADKVLIRFDDPWMAGDMEFSFDCRTAYMENSGQLGSALDFLDCLRYFADVDENKKNVRIDESMIEERSRALAAEQALKWALKNDGVRVYYQPIYSIKEEKIHALEALARVEDEQGRIYMPDEFVPIAEKNGMVLKLGAEVLRQVCRFFREKRLEQLGIDYLEVNLSVVQCMQENLASLFLDIMGEEMVAPFRINLEITETAAAGSDRILLKNMERLMQVGTSFSLDDYGTGYSSLSYVLKFPVRIIKFDKGMVWSYFASEKAAVAMRHEIMMLHDLNAEIVAEGVENQLMYNAMRELGIDDIQGYYFSPPVPGEDMYELLKKWKQGEGETYDL